MARIDIEGNDPDPFKNYPGGSSTFNEAANAAPVVAPPPTPSAPSRPEGGRDEFGNYVPNPVLPGAPNFYWDGDQQRPIPQGTNNGSGSGSGSNGGGGSSNDDALAKAIQEQYQRIFGRGPQGNELATDLDAARRYGLTNPNGPTGGVLGQIAARGNNAPGSGATGNPFQGWSNPNDPRTATSQPQRPTTAPTSGGNFGGASYNAPGYDYPGSQFSDEYTKLLEQIAHNQLDLLQGNNPQTKQLMDFINTKFNTLSNANGYTPDELAILRTQAQEPIMASRDAAQQRELERTARAGYLPTSGITLDQQRQIDTDYGKASAAANRDLAINSINRKDQQMAQALQLGQMGMNIPQQQGAQALDVAGMLYQLPRQAMMDANTIVNGSAPQSVLTPYIQLLQQQQQNAQFQQQQNDQWLAGIGDWLYKIMHG